MSDYNLIDRGQVTVTSSDGAGPRDVTLPGAGVKTTQAFRILAIRDVRRKLSVQRGSQSLTSSSVSPVDIAITAVDLATAVESITFKEKRTNGNSGVTAILNDATHLRLKFDTIASGDTIDVDWKVAEAKQPRGATARLLNATTLRIEWDGTLQAGETITVDYEVVDVNDLKNDVKEVLFREEQLLGFAGYAKLQDLMVYDTPGNLESYRVRVFDTAAHAAAATIDLEAGSSLEPGEIARFQVTVDIDVTTNDRKSLIAQRVDAILTNPDID